MTWGKMDDKAHRNKKVRKLYRMGAKGREAYGVWTFRWSWCLDDPELTGFVPEDELDAGELRAAELLCSDLHDGRGLWEKVEGGYKFHDFHEYNPTKAQVENKRKYDRERKKSEPTPKGFRVDSETTPSGIGAESFPTRVSHSHPIPIPFPSESERARARPEPVDRLPEPEPDTGQEFTDRRMQTAFWAEYEAVLRVPPNMAGKNLTGFHAVVCRTASLQGQDPHTFFVDKVRAWLSNPLGEIERQAPYACFRQAWGDLAAVGEAKGGTGEPETIESLRALGAAAVVRGDGAEVTRISKRIDALEAQADRQVRRAR